MECHMDKCLDIPCVVIPLPIHIQFIYLGHQPLVGHEDIK